MMILLGNSFIVHLFFRFFELNQGKEKLAIEDLWQALFEEKMQSGALNQARIAKSGVMVKNLTSLVHKWEMAGQLDSGGESLSAAQQVNALQHAGIQWYHEEYIPREANIKPAEPVRLVTRKGSFLNFFFVIPNYWNLFLEKIQCVKDKKYLQG